MINVVCDRCGAPLDSSGRVGYIAWNFREGFDGDLERDNLFEKSHFCNPCMEKIFHAIKGEDSATPEPEQIDRRQQAKGKAKKEYPEKCGQQEPPRETRGRKGCDISKILALREAGWSFAKIADEMSMTENSVRAAISRHKKRMEEESHIR